MAERWKEGDDVPEGFSSDTTVGAAAQAILHAMAVRTSLGADELDVEGLFGAWTNTMELNGPEASASLLMAVAALAAGAYFELAKIKETAPGLLLEADAQIIEATLKVMFG